MKGRALRLVGLTPLLAFACARSQPSPGAAPSAAPLGSATERASVGSHAPPTAPSSALPSSLRADIGAMDAGTALRAIYQASKELDDTLAAGAPDCGAVRVLRDRICALSERICELAGEGPPNAALTARCADSRPRCERAKSRVAGPCG